MITDKARFVEQYIVSYMVQAEFIGTYSQYNGTRAHVASRGIEDALRKADIAWDGLEEVKGKKSSYDSYPELKYVFDDGPHYDL